MPAPKKRRLPGLENSEFSSGAVAALFTPFQAELMLTTLRCFRISRARASSRLACTWDATRRQSRWKCQHGRSSL